MDISKRKTYNQNSFEIDIKKFEKELNTEINVEKRIKKLLRLSNRNIRDSILTGEIKINLNKKLNQKQLGKHMNFFK